MTVAYNNVSKIQARASARAFCFRRAEAPRGHGFDREPRQIRESFSRKKAQKAQNIFCRAEVNEGGNR